MQPKQDLLSVAELHACITFLSPTAPSSPLTCRQVGFLNDRLWNFPAAALLVPDGFTPDPLQVAVVAVVPDKGLNLIQQLLAEHQVSLLALR